MADLADLLDIEFEEDLPYDTLAGLILAELGRFPEKGETVEWRGYLFTCEEVQQTAIDKVRIARLEPEAG
jgi:putative hemolysin